MRILVVAPHPDDEILGCGGTMAKFAREGHDVFVVIMTKAGPPFFSKEIVEQGRQEALAAHKLLKVKETIFCDLPAASLDTIPHQKMNAVIAQIILDLKPEIVFVPFWGDIHLDHQNVFLSALVAMRPNQKEYPQKICAYETLSETNWNAPFMTCGFQPNMFVDITQDLSLKLQAFNLYQTQVKPFPHERSVKALEALAVLRGSTMHRGAAEAFIVVREIL